ncbi:MAG TPA: LysM peptidoglycan-binding domain-containing protein [Planctomycetes bacterium]|nr:LysM peptidoglycan-binding domain-containing protein [Planctomycetota bacterium]HIK60874.1 LysM peptidoglycan-binding domain-containing protein [Planctomycetota bacterium]
MGKVEKIVVLGVLFVIVSILAVSLDRGLGGESPEAGGGRVVNAGAPGSVLQQPQVNPRNRGRRVPEPGSAVEATPSAAVTPLLSAEVQVPEAEQSPMPPTSSAPAVIAEDWDLVTLEGLEDHPFDPQMMLYTAGAGEDFVSLSERLYGDAVHAHTLRCNNEGVLAIQEGQVLLVPVTSDNAGDLMHEVASGESLWKIAERIYGEGKGYRCDDIYEANRDVLGSPDDLQQGMMLRVPLLPE